MNSVFVVVAFGGQCEDDWQCNVSAHATEEMARAEIESLKLINMRLIPIVSAVNKVYYETLRAVFQAYKEPHPLPKRPSRGEMTPQDFKNAQAEYSKIVSQRNEKYDAHRIMAQSVASTAALVKALECGATEEDLASVGFSDLGDFSAPCIDRMKCDYNVDTIPFKL